MKHCKFLVFILALGAVLGSARAQVTATDNAALPAYNGGWVTGTNGGTGFGPWNLVQSGSSTTNFTGFLIYSSGSASVDVSNKSFGIYANGTDYNFAIAHRAFNTPLTTNVVFSFKFKNNGIATGKAVGFSLFNGTASPPTADLISLVSAARFSFYFVGGNANYTLYDDGGALLTDVPYHGDGLTLEFSLLAGDLYRLVVKTADGSSIISSTIDGYPLKGTAGSTIDSFACYVLDNDTGGGDLQVNQFRVAATSLVPPVIQNVLPTNTSFFLPTSQTITFDTYSTFSTLNTNNIKVALNGTNVTSYAFTGGATGTNWSVTASPVLAVNQNYNAVITVTDNNGNTTTNTFAFNTWDGVTNLFIEAEAYNYGGGGAILAPFTGQYDAQANIAAVSNIDFFEFADGGSNLYRTNDAVDLEISGDAYDHANYTSLTLTNWSLDYIQYGEWLNYTRRIPTNLAFNVYARYSGGAKPVILCERHANPTATTTNQPRAALGTFIGTDTGNIVSNYNFAPLKDFFGSNVVLRVNQATNTLRLTRQGDGYNFDYLIFVPVSITATQRPYLSAGYPFPGAANVLPDQKVEFTIANRQTTNVTASTKLFVNGADVTTSATFSNNLAGTVVSYRPAALYTQGTTNTIRAVFTDNGGVTQTNDWVFYTGTYLTLSNSFALTTGSGVSNGFSIHMVKYPDTWPANTVPTPVGSVWAEAMLGGSISNTTTFTLTAPDTNVNYAETNVLNYELCGRVSPDGSTFTNAGAAFPFVSLAGYAPCANTNGPGNFALAATFYVQLNAGIQQWAVRSDDGFRLAVGAGATPTNQLIMDYEGGRGAQTPSEFYFIVPVTGVYPMRLLYYQGGFGGSVQFYSIDRTNGTPTLINDPLNPNSIKVYRSSSAAATGVVLSKPQKTGNNVVFSFVTQAGKTHTVQYKTALTNASWSQLIIVAGNGSATNITDNAATTSTRFYRVSTQ